MVKLTDRDDVDHNLLIVKSEVWRALMIRVSNGFIPRAIEGPTN